MGGDSRQLIIAGVVVVCAAVAVVLLLPDPIPDPFRGVPGSGSPRPGGAPDEAAETGGGAAGPEGSREAADAGATSRAPDGTPQGAPDPGEEPPGPRVPEGSGTEGRTLYGAGTTSPGPAPTIRLLDPEVHEELLRRLDDDRTVSYLAIRVRQLAADGLRRFPPGEPAARRAVRDRVGELRRRLTARKRAAATDPEQIEALRRDLLRLDSSLEAWHARVLAGEPAVPEIDL